VTVRKPPWFPAGYPNEPAGPPGGWYLRYWISPTPQRNPGPALSFEMAPGTLIRRPESFRPQRVAGGQDLHVGQRQARPQQLDQGFPHPRSHGARGGRWDPSGAERRERELKCPGRVHKTGGESHRSWGRSAASYGIRLKAPTGPRSSWRWNLRWTPPLWLLRYFEYCDTVC
jgi:hypothetical protein